MNEEIGRLWTRAEGSARSTVHASDVPERGATIGAAQQAIIDPLMV
jgi:hypothetical protein